MTTLTRWFGDLNQSFCHLGLPRKVVNIDGKVKDVYL